MKLSYGGLFNQITYGCPGSSFTGKTQVFLSSRNFGFPVVAGKVSFPKRTHEKFPASISLLKVILISLTAAASTSVAPAAGSDEMITGGASATLMMPLLAFLSSLVWSDLAPASAFAAGAAAGRSAAIALFTATMPPVVPIIATPIIAAAIFVFVHAIMVIAPLASAHPAAVVAAP